MYSKIKIGKHPVHPMLIVFPITFYLLTFVGFLVYQTISNEVFWYKLGYFSNFAAVVSAVIAAIPGTIDWAIGIPKGTAAKKHGLIHMILNLTTLALFAGNAFIIRGNWNNPTITLGTSIFLTAVGSLIVLAAGYYGWDLTSLHKVGVDLSPDQEHLQERYEQEEPPLFH
ncbi:MAG: DUF2231 domain-containing protein [Pseudobdellovibrionaceae bacterium]